MQYRDQNYGSTMEILELIQIIVSSKTKTMRRWNAEAAPENPGPRLGASRRVCERAEAAEIRGFRATSAMAAPRISAAEGLCARS
jgi:hypothetical protein